MATTATDQTGSRPPRRACGGGPGSWGSPQWDLSATRCFLVLVSTDSFLELGIGPNEVPVEQDAIQQFSPDLFHYISHLHIAVAGFIAATGLAVLFLVAYGVRRGQHGPGSGRSPPPLGLAVALPAHYPMHFNALGHLGLIYLATVIFVAGALLALQGIIAQHRG